VANFRHFVVGKKVLEKEYSFTNSLFFVGEKNQTMSFSFINKIITITCNMKGCLVILFSYFYVFLFHFCIFVYLDASLKF